MGVEHRKKFIRIGGLSGFLFLSVAKAGQGIPRLFRKDQNRNITEGAYADFENSINFIKYVQVVQQEVKAMCSWFSGPWAIGWFGGEMFNRDKPNSDENFERALC